MGGGASQPTQPITPIPQYNYPPRPPSPMQPQYNYPPRPPSPPQPQYNYPPQPQYNYPPQPPSPPPPQYNYPPQYSNVARNPPPLTRWEQHKLEKAYKTIQKLQPKMSAPIQPMPPITRSSSVPFMPPSPPPISRPSSPSYGGPPIMNVSQPAPPFPYAQGQFPQPYGSSLLVSPTGVRDTDFATIASISGFSPTDIALLHNEYMKLTGGGRQKFDRVIFRQLLRDILIQANNENIERSIESTFVSIDRNRDGFIDFPEFVGAFRDILRGRSVEAPTNLAKGSLPNSTNEHISNQHGTSGLICQPVALIQQPQTAAQVITIPSIGAQQPATCDFNAPIVISVDSNQPQCIPYMCG